MLPAAQVYDRYCHPNKHPRPVKNEDVSDFLPRRIADNRNHPPANLGSIHLNYMEQLTGGAYGKHL